MKKFVVLVPLLLLGACAGNNSLATLTANDTAVAVNIANSVGDAAGATCWGALNKLAVAAGGGVNMATMTPTNNSPGLATLVEVKRSVTQTLETSCAPITASFLINTLHGLAGPFAGLLP